MEVLYFQYLVALESGKNLYVLFYAYFLSHNMPYMKFVSLLFYIYFIIYAFRLCLGAWSDHGERTGGFYACNRYETAKQEGVVYL